MTLPHPTTRSVSTSDQPASFSRHFVELDGLRGIAILMVFIFHYVSINQSTGLVVSMLRVVLKNLGAGVEIFFVLSGFLITLILLDTRGNRLFFVTFFARRFLRIFPIYYGVLAVVFLLVPSLGISLSPRFLGSQVWLWTFTTNIKTTLTGGHETFIDSHVQLHHFWSLAVEEQFYLVWPVLVAFTSRRVLGVACLFCLIVSPLCRLGLTLGGASGIGINSFTPCQLDALGAGSLLAVAHSSGLLRTNLSRPMALLLVLSLTGFASFVLAAELLPSARYLFPVLGHLVLTGVGVGLVAGCLCFNPAGPYRQIMRGRSLRLLGKYSYGLYVYHLVFFPAIEAFVSTKILQQTFGLSYIPAGLLHALLAGLICFAIAFASWQLIERPILSLKRYFPYYHPPQPTHQNLPS